MVVGGFLPAGLAEGTEAAGGEATVGLHVGQAAPDFTLPLLNGETVTLSELRGQPVILNFWATWCPPCVREMPDLQAVFDELDGAVHVLGVSCGEAPDTVSAFIDKNGYTYPIAYDADALLYRAYTLDFIPQTWVLNEEGIIIRYIAGMTNADTLRQALPE